MTRVCSVCQKEPVPDDFLYCSSECNVASLLTKKSKELTTSDLITTAELASALGVHYGTIINWTKRKKIPVIRISPKRFLYNLDEVKKALSMTSENQINHEIQIESQLSTPPDDSPAPEPHCPISSEPHRPISATRPVKPQAVLRSHPSLHIRDTLLSLYREMTLEEVEKAEASGDQTRAFHLLKDFLIREQKLAEVLGDLP